MSFKALKNYVTAETASAVPASPRASGSGRVRKKKRPYSPPHEPVKAVSTAKKQKVESKTETAVDAKEKKKNILQTVRVKKAMIHNVTTTTIHKNLVKKHIQNILNILKIMLLLEQMLLGNLLMM